MKVQQVLLKVGKLSSKSLSACVNNNTKRHLFQTSVTFKTSIALKSKFNIGSSWSSSHKYSTKNNSSENENELMNELRELGYDNSDIAKGMLEVLAQCYNKNMATLEKSSIQSFGKSGLDALYKSVEQERNKKTNSTSFKGTINFVIEKENYNFSLSLHENESIQYLVKETSEGRELLGEYLEFACGGNMSCSTCHVYLDNDTFQKLDKASEAEMDMIDLAYEPRSTSRLACQICMKPDLNHMTLTIPSSSNNFWS